MLQGGKQVNIITAMYQLYRKIVISSVIEIWGFAACGHGTYTNFGFNEITLVHNLFAIFLLYPFNPFGRSIYCLGKKTCRLIITNICNSKKIIFSTNVQIGFGICWESCTSQGHTYHFLHGDCSKSELL